MRGRVLSLLFFAVGVVTSSCTQQEIPPEEGMMAKPGEGPGSLNKAVIPDADNILVGSLPGYVDGRWALVSFYAHIYDAPPYGLKEFALQMKMDGGNPHARPDSGLIPFSQLDSFVRSIDQIVQRAADLRDDAEAEDHIHLDTANGPCLVFVQKGREPRAYLNFRHTAPSVVLGLDLDHLPRLKEIVIRGAQKLKARGAKQAQYAYQYAPAQPIQPVRPVFRPQRSDLGSPRSR